eukprot:Blabericola_migrator_1__3892@NODE_2177_length_3166_cov_215_360762_g1372_i0_p3_GENE_NODE_2177_length_3166_cov_215_360762_g1372_i0NODE_2177_length_3166_cov_215_360762_g1372_i0_p3_ORF_typecomplete_len178_score37_84MutS_III/PF05192_18/0_15Med29/PF11568_8/1_6e03Med29/PF11568_8/0_24_NODE_2177_length_3166_cov_215_360762_g1372_i016272160
MITTNTAILVQYVELIDALIHRPNVQAKIAQAADFQEIAKVLNRNVSSQENLAPALLQACDACQSFFKALEPETLASLILDAHHEALRDTALADAGNFVRDGIRTGLDTKFAESQALKDSIYEMASESAQLNLMLESVDELDVSNVVTHVEKLRDDLKGRCDQILSSLPLKATQQIQ